MAKGRDLNSYQQKVVKRYYDNIDTAMTQKLGEMVSDLYLADTEAKSKRLWERVSKAMANLKVEPDLIGPIMQKKDIEKLALLIGELSMGNLQKKQPSQPPRKRHVNTPPLGMAPIAPAPPPPAAINTGKTKDPGAPPYDQPYLRHAMKQFKRRIKLSRLDAESALGRSPMTGGHSSGIVAISPPPDFKMAVWEELVKQGRLKKAGNNLYSML